MAEESPSEPLLRRHADVLGLGKGVAVGDSSCTVTVVGVASIEKVWAAAERVWLK